MIHEEHEDPNDEKITERQALADAEAQGITFVDEFKVIPIDPSSPEVEHPKCDTREEAEKILNKIKNKEDYTISQIRTRAA